MTKDLREELKNLPLSAHSGKLGDVITWKDIDNILEAVGDTFAPKKPEGSPERKKLLKLIGDIQPYRERLEEAILDLIEAEVREAEARVLGLVETDRYDLLSKRDKKILADYHKRSLETLQSENQKGEL